MKQLKRKRNTLLTTYGTEIELQQIVDCRNIQLNTLFFS